MAHQPIASTEDTLLTVWIDRDNAAAPVWYSYDDRDDQPTPFQTADMPMDDQKAAAKVSEWLDMQA